MANLYRSDLTDDAMLPSTSAIAPPKNKRDATSKLHLHEVAGRHPPRAETKSAILLLEGDRQSEIGCADWQRAYRRLFEVAALKKPDGTPKRCHPHMLRDTFAIELLLAGVPSTKSRSSSVTRASKITEKHYAPWVKARQDQLEKSVRAAWHSGDKESAA